MLTKEIIFFPSIFIKSLLYFLVWLLCWAIWWFLLKKLVLGNYNRIIFFVFAIVVDRGKKLLLPYKCVNYREWLLLNECLNKWLVLLRNLLKNLTYFRFIKKGLSSSIYRFNLNVFTSLNRKFAAISFKKVTWKQKSSQPTFEFICNYFWNLLEIWRPSFLYVFLFLIGLENFANITQKQFWKHLASI